VTCIGRASVDGILRPTPDRERSQPIKWVTSKIPEIAKVGSPREWFLRIAVLF
jgi:hypothetical protein